MTIPLIKKHVSFTFDISTVYNTALRNLKVNKLLSLSLRTQLAKSSQNIVPAEEIEPSTIVNMWVTRWVNDIFGTCVNHQASGLMTPSAGEEISDAVWSHAPRNAVGYSFEVSSNHDDTEHFLEVTFEVKENPLFSETLKSKWVNPNKFDSSTTSFVKRAVEIFSNDTRRSTDYESSRS